MKNCARHLPLLAIVLLAVLQLSSCALTPDSFHSVILSPKGTVIVGQGSTVAITANVLNDTNTNGGVIFAASPAGVGTLTQLSTTSANYVAPGNVTSETIVTITAVSVDFPKKSSTLTVKVEPPPVITTTSLSAATLNQPYSQPVTATGGVPPLAWTIASGSLPAGLALAPSTTDTVNITGQPTTAGNSTFTITVTDATGTSSTSGPLNIVVSTLAFTTTSPLTPGMVNTAYPGVQFAATGGTAPYTFSLAAGSTLPAGLMFSSGDLTGIPTAAGTFTFGVTVTDSEATPASITQTFTLVINGQQNLALLTGSFAFSFSGNNTSGFVAAAGTITADGAGAITGGDADFTTLQAHTLFTGITGSYTAGVDGRGTITLTSVTGSPTFAFAIDAGGSGHGRLIEFDGTGTRGSGRLEAQSVSTCIVSGTGTNTYSGPFAFGGSGFASTFATGGAGPVAFAGTFTASPPVSPATQGSLGSGEMDSNAPNNVQFGAGANNVSGVYQSGADSTHCTMALSTSGLASPNYDVYPVSSSEAFLIETDTVSGTAPYVTIADMKQQLGQPFSPQPLSGAMAGGTSGQVLNGTFLPYVSVIQIVPTTGSGSFEFSLADNTAGTVTNTNGTPFTVTYTSDQFGRVDTAGFTVNSEFQPILYLVSSDEAFCVSMLSGGPIVGHFEPQTLTAFTPASIQATLVEGTSAPAVSADRDLSGFLTFDGVSAVSGTQDESTSSATTAAEAVTGTYALSTTGGTDGSGTVTLTAPAKFTGAFFILSPTQMVMITTTANDTNPVLIIIGH
jgi:putative Ig domain-containing protein